MVSVHASNITMLYRAVQETGMVQWLTLNFIISLFLATDADDLTSLGFPTHQFCCLSEAISFAHSKAENGASCMGDDLREGTMEQQREPLTLSGLAPQTFIIIHFFKIKPSLSIIWPLLSYSSLHFLAHNHSFSVIEAYHLLDQNSASITNTVKEH